MGKVFNNHGKERNGNNRAYLLNHSNSLIIQILWSFVPHQTVYNSVTLVYLKVWISQAV